MIIFQFYLHSFHLNPKNYILSMDRHVNSILDSFENIYHQQDNGMAYENVIDLLSAMNPEFPKLLQISTAEYLQSQGFSEDIIKELVEATLVVNYGQNTDVHSFVGCVSIAGAGAGLWSVKGGNKEVRNSYKTQFQMNYAHSNLINQQFIN